MKILIISGGSIDEMWGRKWVADYEPDYCIAADSGLVMADKLGLTVDLLLGDYDSVDKKIFEKYSLGMKQRLGIAAAIMHKPEILILDEPMNGLDPIGIYEMREYLVNLCKEGNTTVFISSHILSEIEQIADVIGVMNHGRLLEEESITDLHKRLRRYAEYEVSNVEYVFSLLKERLDVSEILIDSKNRIRLFGKDMHRIEEINSYLIQNNIPIRQIRIEEEKLEDYFSELIGGGEIG